MLLDGKQDGGLVFDGAAEAEPRGQRDAACCLWRQIAEIEDDQAEASAFEKQVGGAQDLLQAVLCLIYVLRSISILICSFLRVSVSPW
jgi:hypothetical protein